MSKPFHDSHHLINQVENYLSSKLQENSDFNNELNKSASISIAEEEPRVRITSLTDAESEFKYDVSDILYWVERDTYFDELTKWNGTKLDEAHRDAVDYLKESKQLSTFMDLVDAIKRQRIAPFIGAGSSLPAGYSTWRATLEGIASEMGDNLSEMVQEDLDNYKYLEAAEKLYIQGEHHFTSSIRKEFRLKPSHENDKPTFPSIVNLLPHLTSSCIITTNFDRLIEKRFELMKGKPLTGYMYGKQEQNGFVSQLLKGEHCLMKLHGDVDQPQSYVFTESQYLEAYGPSSAIDFTKQLPRSLRQIYISHALLFIGCSLEQDRTLELFKSVKDEGHFEIPDHFALIPEADATSKAEKISRLLSMNINPIWYKTENKDHSMLNRLLELAIDVANKKYSLGGI